MAYTPPIFNAVNMGFTEPYLPAVYSRVNLLLADNQGDLFERQSVVDPAQAGFGVYSVSALSADSLVESLTGYALDSAIIMGDGSDYIIETLLNEFMGVASTVLSQSNLTVSKTEQMVLQDALRVHLELVLADTFSGGDTLDYCALTIVVESLSAVATPISSSQLFGALAEVLSAADLLARGQLETVSESLTVSETLALVSSVYRESLEQLSATATTNDSLFVFAALSETVALDTSLSAQQVLYQLVQEGLSLSIRLLADNEWYTGWVMNTELLAPSEYQNVPFNSVCRLGDKYLAASDSGIYELSGSTDAGNQVATLLQTGVLDFGTNQLKRIEAMYLGYSATGQLKLRVDLAVRGEQQTYWYNVDANYIGKGGAPTNGRVLLGKGMNSLYYRFSLTNSEGCDVLINQLSILPAVTTRRV